ncbi:MAG TPA: AMP-binding protein [Vulgatibacter sp.]|nr:AMP-binding protein [Vulgatibacter sp.]
MSHPTHRPSENGADTALDARAATAEGRHASAGAASAAVGIAASGAPSAGTSASSAGAGPAPAADAVLALAAEVVPLAAPHHARHASPGWDLSVTEALRGRRILFTGATGFVGKVALSMLLTRFPEIEKIYVLARPGVSTGADARFWGKVIVAPPFDPLRARLGPGFEAYVRDKCEPVAGDVSKRWCGFPDELLERLEGNVDLLINSAGLVDFNPTLEAGLNANALGALHVAETAKRIGARLLHVSTCFVVGNAPGIVPEDESILGYFPKRDERPTEEFDPFAEIADCQATIARIKAEADDKALLAELRAKAIERLHDDGRDDGDAKAVRTGTMRERKVWMTERQVRAGLDRARYWGWPNTYCYTKSLGDQVIDSFSRKEGLDFTIVRPAIVESALRFPFPGWNEGFTTTAPLSFFSLKGHRTFPAKKGLILDVIPVDHIAAGVIAASAALLEGKARKVYQLGTSDTNPLRVDRAIELLGLYRRRHYLEKASREDRLKNELLARIEPQAVPRSTYERRSAPEIAKLARKATELLDRVKPSWGAPRIGASIERLQDGLELTSRRAQMAADLFEIFLPFVWENSFRFSSKNMAELHARMDPADAEKIPWDPESIDWLTYWLDVHMAGMEKWIFPNLEDEFGVKTRKKGPPVHRDLWELLEARARRHPGKVAMRAYRKDGTSERFTYGQLRDRAVRASCYLVASGVAREDRVVLAAENGPEWSMVYFGGVHAGATLVPVDHQSSREELENVVRSSGAKVIVASESVLKRLGLSGAPAGVERDEEEAKAPRGGGAGGAPGELPGARVIALAQIFEGALPADVPFAPREPAELASLIFTSGTTGKPKGVMLTQRNFTSLVSKLAGAFDLGERDGLLSVLPLHHTFEFTAGLLVPLACGAEIAYLEELTGDSLEAAFATGRITAMVGVPAVWQLLLRRIESQLADKGLEATAQALQGAVNNLDTMRTAAGKAIFFPVHRKLGGRLRILISGGSAMPPEVYEAFQGMGFEIFEGYGLTEAAPVLTVQTKGHNRAGHVGKALPGIEVRIDAPDADGVGEIVAKGPNVMSGYWNDPEATAEVLVNGWLRTGDLGRLDEDGHLVIVGRRKDVIIDANGKNVYPDELEDLYAGCPEVKELSIVGLSDGGAEKVACLVVPIAPDEGRSAADIERAIQAHFREVGLRLPMWKRVKVLQFSRAELPRTATRKVKRPLVAETIARLEAEQRAGRKGAAADGDAWLYELVARVCEQPREKVRPESRLEQDLGFDSLMFTELGAALQSAGVGMPAPEEVMSIATVGELARKVAGWKRAAARGGGAAQARAEAPRAGTKGIRENAKALLGSVLDAVQPSLDRVPFLSSAVALARTEGLRFLDDLVPPGSGAKAEEDESIELPEALVAAGKTMLRTGQRNLYEVFFETKVYGRAHVPQHTNFLVAANHASHLDMGLVKHALGEQGENLVALAATDYFFSNKVRRAFFENFTQLIPMNRHGSLRESLELASRSLRQGRNLLIFPEGTRATDGTLKDFKGSLGYLALTNEVGILPIYLDGTYEALPKGSVVPKARDLAAHIGPFLSYEELEAAVAGLPRSEQHREIARRVEAAVRALEAGCRGEARDATVTPMPAQDAVSGSPWGSEPSGERAPAASEGSEREPRAPASSAAARKGKR